MRKNIAILCGGDSAEHAISVKSAKQVLSWINFEKYTPYLVNLKKNNWNVILENGIKIPVDIRDFSITLNNIKFRFDYAFIIIHGDPGENGKIQSYLELQNIPYNTSGILSSALSFNKHFCKLFLKNSGIISPESILLKKGNTFNCDDIKEKVGLPCFVKPNKGGSSLGASRVTKLMDLDPAIKTAFAEDNEVLVESFIKGIEISCGLLKTKQMEYIFPITEIVPKKDFFDYEAKYTEGMSDEITPARVSEEVTKKCRNISSEIYDLLNCRGIVRIDYIVKGNQLYFLELNSIPGLTKESIVPKQIRTMGLTMEEIIDLTISDTIEN